MKPCVSRGLLKLSILCRFLLFPERRHFSGRCDKRSMRETGAWPEARKARVDERAKARQFWHGSPAADGSDASNFSGMALSLGRAVPKLGGAIILPLRGFVCEGTRQIAVGVDLMLKRRNHLLRGANGIYSGDEATG